MILREDEIGQLLDATEPTPVDIARAKKLILAGLATGADDALSLTTCLRREEGISSPERGEALDMTNRTDVDPRDPTVLRVRYDLASQIALRELVFAGLVIAQQEPVGNSYNSVAVRRGGTSGGERIPRGDLVGIGSSFRLSRHMIDDPAIAVLDPDIFTHGLDGLGLDDRTLRSLHEALHSYQRGLYLACASLLGAVSEGAWYSAGERLRVYDERLGKALDNDRASAVCSRATELFRQVPRKKTEATDVATHATRMRDIRNYGVHPRASTDASLEHYFTEHGAGLLLLDTHRYLSRLSALTQSAVDHFHTGE